ALGLFPKDFKEVEANVDIFPLNDSSPVKPFTSFVLNINVETVAHKDNGDNNLCIVLDLGEHTGGGLFLTHFNLKYEAIRCSAVIHSDKDGISYQNNGNGWDGNMSTRSSTVTSATGKSSSAVTASSKSITKSKAANVKNRGASPAPSSTCLSRPPLGPRAAEYVELQAQRSEEEKRKKDIREKVKAVKASEEADISEEEEITATSPPATSDVDEEEFNQ
ncbi:hypothetical protein FB446DRAFT_710266, partial [Lentinula raphanica]